MATTVCLINQKGGCGKSTTCFHLAGAFARLGKRVLLIDVDPQGSLSQGFFGSASVESLNAGATVAAVFDDTQFVADPEQLILDTPFDAISLVPANQHLATFNTPQPEHTGMLQYSLKEFIESTVGFDIVLIDCPPNLYRCSWSAMIAAEEVIIPVPPEDFGTQGLRAVHQTVEYAQRLNPALRLMGHLVTRRDKRLVIHRMYEERIRLLYGTQVLETILPEAAAFKVALAGRTPVEFDQPRSAAADLTRQLAREILDRMSQRATSEKEPDKRQVA